MQDVGKSNELMQLVKTRTPRNMQDSCQEVIYCSTVFQDCFQQFDGEIQSNKYVPMAGILQSGMIQFLLDYIKSSRNGNWDLHLTSIENILPWFHAYDMVNYARHFTYFWVTLKNLPGSKSLSQRIWSHL